MCKPIKSIKTALFALTLSAVATAAGAADSGTATTTPTTTSMGLEQKHDITYEEFVRLSAKQAIKALDRNGDGAVTPEEAKAPDPAASDPSAISIKFSDADRDKDVHLSEEELNALLTAHPLLRAWFDAQDVDHDGSLSVPERQGMKALPLIRIDVP